MKIEFDANDGSGFDELGTSEILSVPYALYSMASSTVIMPLEISYDNPGGFRLDFVSESPGFFYLRHCFE